MDDIKEWCTDNLDTKLRTTQLQIIDKHICTLNKTQDVDTKYWMSILYLIKRKNMSTLISEESIEKIASIFGAIGGLLYFIRVQIDGGISIWSQLLWCISAITLVYYFYITHQYPLMWPQAANVVLALVSILSIQRHLENPWEQI